MRYSFAAVLLAATTTCREYRSVESTGSSSSFETTIGPLLASRCERCHGAPLAGGWSPASYLSAIACTDTGAPAVLPRDASAPILRVQDDSVHAGVLTADERATLAAWVRNGAPLAGTTVHPAGFADPREPQGHAQLLRDERWVSMLDPNAPSACGRCHEGVPRPEHVTTTAPGAPACTTCHTDPGGPQACSTCHGSAGAPYPPRDPCFTPDPAATRKSAGAHAVHAGPSPARAVGLACSTCHPTPNAGDLFSGVHANGHVDVVFDPAVAPGASYDATTGGCTSSCHARPGGTHPNVTWTDAPGQLGCNGCHGSPPPNHFAGACSDCHREANANGTALVNPVLHVNGKVDLGDGSGKCGACHGAGDDPWPSTNAHPAHRAPRAAKAVPCETCHVVPTTFGPGTGHPHGGPARITFSGLALARGATPTYAAGACANVYCHGAKLEGTTPAQPAWTNTSGSARACGACHSLPPGPPHFQSPTCDLCHSPVAEPGQVIPPANAPLHVDGEVER